MEHRTCNTYVVRAGLGRRPRILVEDDTIDLDVLDLTPPGSSAFEVIVCVGPDGPESCPLVTDGVCPMGRPDVVVSSFSADNPWGRCVRAAWEADGVPVAHVGAGEGPLVWPAHLGAAVRTLYPHDDE
jgi:hypothetical protein